MTVWIIIAFFVGALFGGVAMSCLAAGGKAEKGKRRQAPAESTSTRIRRG